MILILDGYKIYDRFWLDRKYNLNVGCKTWLDQKYNIDLS